jgi:hypothetical protein
MVSLDVGEYCCFIKRQIEKFYFDAEDGIVGISDSNTTTVVKEGRIYGSVEFNSIKYTKVMVPTTGGWHTATPLLAKWNWNVEAMGWP